MQNNFTGNNIYYIRSNWKKLRPWPLKYSGVVSQTGNLRKFTPFRDFEVILGYLEKKNKKQSPFLFMSYVFWGSNTPPALPFFLCIRRAVHFRNTAWAGEKEDAWEWTLILRCEDNVNQNGIKKNTENKYSGDYTFLCGKYNRFFQLTPKYLLIFL